MENISKCYRYIYETTLPNGKVYVGKHTPKCKGEAFDWYLGSGVILTRYIEKHGREGIVKRILVEGEFTVDEINALEKKYVAEYMLKENCINLARGGDGGDTSKFIDYKNPERNEKLRASGKQRATEEYRKRASQASKAAWERGVYDNIYFGHKVTDEQKRKISEAMKTNANFMKGKHWYNNGKEEILVENCPEGFLPGKIERKEKFRKQVELFEKSGYTSVDKENIRALLGFETIRSVNRFLQNYKALTN